METNFKIGTKAKKFIWAIIILWLISFIINLLFPTINYNSLLNADTLNIYSKGELITSVNEPGYMIHTFNGAVGLTGMTPSQAGIKRFNISQLYRLEFIKDEEIISNIKIYTPKNPDKIDEDILTGGYWHILQGKYVVMYERFDYFIFGEDFFSELDKVLLQIDN